MDSSLVVHIRSQETFVESYYLQRVHEGYYGPFDEWISGVDLGNISWRPMVDGLIEAFGLERITVLDFDTIRAGQKQFLSDFLEVIAPGQTVSVAYPPLRNPSISAQGLRIALNVNPLLETAIERKAMRKFLQREFNNTKGKRPTLLSAEQSAELRNAYADENAEILKTNGHRRLIASTDRLVETKSANLEDS